MATGECGRAAVQRVNETKEEKGRPPPPPATNTLAVQLRIKKKGRRGVGIALPNNRVGRGRGGSVWPFTVARHSVNPRGCNARSGRVGDACSFVEYSNGGEGMTITVSARFLTFNTILPATMKVTAAEPSPSSPTPPPAPPPASLPKNAPPAAAVGVPCSPPATAGFGGKARLSGSSVSPSSPSSVLLPTELLFARRPLKPKSDFSLVPTPVPCSPDLRRPTKDMAASSTSSGRVVFQSL